MKLILNFRICPAKKLVGARRNSNFGTAGLTGRRRSDESFSGRLENQEFLWGEVQEILRDARQIAGEEQTGRNDLRYRETRSSKECFFQELASGYEFWSHKTPQ